jgi:hypothetical protein
MWAKIIATLTGQTVESVLAYKTAKRTLKANIELERLNWKDEWVLIVLSIPMILVFIPFTQPFITAGFASLATTPLWYRTTVMTIYLATFGLRLWRRDMNQAGAPSIT